MNTRYCAAAGCGKPNPYTAIKPKFCSSCGAPFDAAFSTVTAQPYAAPVNTLTVHSPLPHRPEQSAPPQRVFRNAKGEDISHLYQQQPAQGRRESVQNDDEYYDRDAAREEAHQLAASIRGTIHIGTEEANKPVRLGDLPNIQKAVADAGKGGKKTRARK